MKLDKIHGTSGKATFFRRRLLFALFLASLGTLVPTSFSSRTNISKRFGRYTKRYGCREDDSITASHILSFHDCEHDNVVKERPNQPKCSHPPSPLAFHCHIFKACCCCGYWIKRAKRQHHRFDTNKQQNEPNHKIYVAFLSPDPRSPRTKAPVAAATAGPAPRCRDLSAGWSFCSGLWVCPACLPALPCCNLAEHTWRVNGNHRPAGLPVTAFAS